MNEAYDSRYQLLKKKFPLPQDLYVVTPDAALPPSSQAFSGIWQGAWSNDIPHLLVVEYISPSQKVQIIYSIAMCETLQNFEGVFYRLTGEIEDDTLRVLLPHNARTVTYSHSQKEEGMGVFLEAHYNNTVSTQMNKIV